MTSIQIITLQFKENDTLFNAKRVMIEKLGEKVFRIYCSIKEQGKVFSPFVLNEEIYDSATSALFSQSFSGFSKVINADNQTSDLLTSDEIKSVLKLDDMTKS